MQFGSVKARVMRVTAIDSEGRPLGGAAGSITSGGFINVTVTPEYEAGEVRRVRSLWGDLCQNRRETDRLLSNGLTLTLCGVDPSLIGVMASGARVLTDATDEPIGVALSDARVDDPTFALEVWSKEAGADDCVPGGWVHWCWPRVRPGQVTAWTLEYGPLNVALTAVAEKATHAWRQGPYMPPPSDLAAVEGDFAYFGRTTVDPPAALGPVFFTIDSDADTDPAPGAPTT